MTRVAIVILGALAGLIAVSTFLAQREDGSTAPATVPVESPETREDKVPSMVFTDVTAESGVTFVHTNGAAGDRLLPETMGSGVTVFDFDNDSLPDLLFADGKPWPWDDADGQRASLHLYRNVGQGRFERVPFSFPVGDYTFATAAGDFDGDGWTDLYVANLGPDRLLQNQGGQGFAEVPLLPGSPETPAWTASAAFVDVDGDQWLDLLVAPYVEWSRDIDFEVDYRLSGVGRAYGPPLNFEATPPRVLRNLNGQGFEDITATVLSTNGASTGKALALRPSDLDNDGDIDWFVANDTVGNFWFQNNGEGRFSEVGVETGLAFDTAGASTGAMGVDRGWLSDGTPVLAVANFANEMTSLFASSEMGFADEAVSLGIGPASRLALSFGLLFFDADMDGAVDLMQVNGHVEPSIARVQSSQQYRQAPQLFWQCGQNCNRWFVPVENTGALGELRVVGRALATIDLEGDGDLDVVITENGGPARLLRNDSPVQNGWLSVRLRQPGPNVHAIGARVSVEGTSGEQFRDIMPTRSYLTQVEPVAHFGLGSTEPASVSVRWPDGEMTRHVIDAINATITIARE